MALTESPRAKAALLAAALFLAGSGLFAQGASPDGGAPAGALGVGAPGGGALGGGGFAGGAPGSGAPAGAPRQLGAEAQRLEQALASGLPPAQRREALVGLARLRQLSGNLAAAAGHWLEAAALDPSDDFALVSGAYCLAAIGEWERALAAIQPLLASGRGGPAAARARYLEATLRAWTTADISGLAALAFAPEAAAMRPVIYYTLWWTTARDPAAFGGAAEAWRQRLIAGYPGSPEARIVAGQGAAAIGAAAAGAEPGAPAISAIHSPLWLLLPGVPEGTPLGIPEGSALAELMRSPVSAATPHGGGAQQGSAWQGAPHGGGAAAPLPARGQQTGLFRSETNAMAHAESLRGAGFPAVVSRRLSGGSERWAVVVPAADPAAAALALRAAGHDSFTVALD